MYSELGLRGLVIFVAQSRDDGFSDGSQVGYGLDGLRFDVRGPLLPGLVRPVAVHYFTDRRTKILALTC